MKDEVELNTNPSGHIMEVRVQPRASRPGVRIMDDGRLRVAVTAPPVDDAANEAVCAYLAKSLGVPRRAVAIVSGMRGRNKSVRIENIGADEIMEKLKHLATK